MSDFVGVFIRQPALVAMCGEAELPPVGTVVEAVRLESGAQAIRWPGMQVAMLESANKAGVQGMVDRVKPLRSAAPGSAWILYLAG